MAAHSVSRRGWGTVARPCHEHLPRTATSSLTGLSSASWPGKPGPVPAVPPRGRTWLPSAPVSEAIPSVAPRLRHHTCDHEASGLRSNAASPPPARVVSAKRQSLPGALPGLGRRVPPYVVLSTAPESPPTDPEKVTRWPAVTAPRFQG